MSKMTNGRFRALARFGALTAVAVLALSACSAEPDAGAETEADTVAAADYGLVNGDKVTIATTSTMPNASLVGGEWIGFEAEMAKEALGNLGLEYDVTMTDFPGMLSSVQTGRADIAIGSIAWREKRTETGIFTNPPFFTPLVVAHSPEVTFDSVDDLAGKRVGTVSGYIFVDVLKDNPDVDLQVYADSAGVFTDLQSGRLDVALVDSLNTIYVKTNNPDMDFEYTIVTPPTVEEYLADPTLGAFTPPMYGWYLSAGNEKLQEALDVELDRMLTDGTTKRLLEEAGIDSDVAEAMMAPATDEWLEFFTQQRRDIDRAADWQMALGD